MTTLKGPEAGRYYVDGLPSYYLDAGEPAGVWSGHGASVLGLSGTIDADEFVAVMSGLHPTTGQHLGRRFGDASVRGFDVTCSAPKSVSVLFAVGNDATRAEVLGAHDAAVSALVGWIEAHAHTRFRTMGVVGVFDAEGIMAASFRQHTSRVLDPQLHTHVVIPNRVLAPDGRWLALDARTLKLDQRTLSAIYHAGLRAELTSRLGVGWEPVVNGIADVAGVPAEVLAEFSTRASQVDARIAVKLERFEQTMGREPTPRERWRLEREAVTDSRPAKPHGVEGSSLHVEWRDRVTGLWVDPVRLVEDVVERVDKIPTLNTHAADLIGIDAVTALSESQSTWRPAEIVRETAALTPTNLAATAVEVMAHVESIALRVEARSCVDLSAPVMPGVRLRRDGRPVTEAVSQRALTTEAILHEEARILEWAERATRRGGVDELGALRNTLKELSVGQAECAAAVAGTRDLVLVVGPAGTGKTTALAPAVTSLQREGVPVFAVAPSAVAAQVLGEESGVRADTIDKFLYEHSRRQGPGPGFALPEGGVLIVDEAGMMSTTHLAAIAQLAGHQRWLVRLIGDPLQFSAVGRGGMFGLLTDSHDVIELDRVHRFEHDWERQASLQLRHGDPEVAEVYAGHGRIHGGIQEQMDRAVIAAWWNARLRGEEVAVMAATNETVHRLNVIAQDRRVRAGELAPAASIVLSGRRFCVGDEVVTRRNQRDLLTDSGEMVKNRDRFTLTSFTATSVTVSGRTGTVTLPLGYAQDFLELGYAQTGHGSQGRTVDTAILLIDSPIDVRGVYVPMTRGRHSNTAYVVCDTGEDPVEVFADAMTRDWIDQPAHVRYAELNPMLIGPGIVDVPELLPDDVLAELIRRGERLGAVITALNDRIRAAPGRVATAEADRERLIAARATVVGRITVGEEKLDGLDRFGHRHRNRPAITGTRQRLEIHRSELVALDQQLIDAEATLVERRRGRAGIDDLRAERDRHSSESHQIGDQLDADAAQRAIGARDDLRVIGEIGTRPTGHEAISWDRVAGRLAQQRIAFSSRNAFEINHYLEQSRRQQTVPTIDRARRSSRSLDDDYGLSL